MTNMILLGPPGSGKTTQARILSQNHGMQRLSIDALLPEAMASASASGRAAEAAIRAGLPVAEGILAAIVRERLDRCDAAAGIVFDGPLPSLTLAQALEGVLSARKMQLDTVVHLDLTPAASVQRLAGRCACAECGSGYHVTLLKPRVQGVCDTCGARRFKRRGDDLAGTAAQRVKTYGPRSAALRQHYELEGVLRTVDASGPPCEIAAQLGAMVGRTCS